MVTDENVLRVTKLMAGLYSLLKTTLLSPRNYNELGKYTVVVFRFDTKQTDFCWI